MKGLLLKDWYAIKTYFRSLLVLYAVFLIASCFSERNTFFLFYPCILSGSIAMSLIAYEEKEKWNLYAATLPYSRTQLVSAKYLMTLLVGAGTVLMITVVQIGVLLHRQMFSVGRVLDLVFLLIVLCLLPTAILLPFVYRFGAEKGRFVYFIVLGVFFGLIVLIGGMQQVDLWPVSNSYWNAAMVGITALLFGGSWRLAIHFYEKRELNG